MSNEYEGGYKRYQIFFPIKQIYDEKFLNVLFPITNTTTYAHSTKYIFLCFNTTVVKFTVRLATNYCMSVCLSVHPFISVFLFVRLFIWIDRLCAKFLITSSSLFTRINILFKQNDPKMKNY
jgi:hypothetical protein